MADRRARGREASLDVDALALLLEQPGLGVCLVAGDGRILRVNDEWLRGTGQPSAVVGARLEDVAPEEDDPLRLAFSRARSGERVELPRRRVLLDGRETHWDAAAAAVPSPEGTAVLFSIRRVAEEAPGADEPAAVRRSRVLLAAVLENAPTAIAVFGSADRRIHFANRASQSLLDVREPGAPFVGRLLSEVSRDPGPLEELVQLVAVSGAPLTDDEYELRLARGTTFWRWSLHPLPSPGDEPDVLLIATEMTEQVQARRAAEASALRAAAAEGSAREAAWRIARLQRVTASMSAALTAHDLERALVGAALPVTGAAAAAVWGLDADGLRLLASTGVPDRPGAPTALDAPTPAGAAARAREPLFLGGADEVAARFPQTAASRRALGHAALAALPLALAGRAAGALVLDWREARAFPQDERELLEAVATQCAQTVERARLHAETQAARARAERLGETLASLNAGATETEVLHAAAEAALRTLGGVGAAFLREAAPDAGLVAIHETRPPGRLGTRFAPADLPHVGEALAAGRPVLVTRAEGRGVEPRWMEVLRARATLVVPIVRGATREGALLVDYADGMPLPGPDALALAGEVSTQCAIALERARLVERERAARAAAETATAEAHRTGELQRQLMAVVGHDLRAQLQVISMGARVLGQRGHLREQDAATLARVSAAATRAGGIISDLLDLARARQGLLVRVAPAPVDLAALLRRVAAEMAAETGARPPDVVAPAPVPGSFDPERLAQLLRTLAEAARARGGPGVRVELHARAEDGGARLAVRDDGPAIPDADLPGLFEPFGGRPPPPGTSVEGGAGLALFVASEIVRAHRGRIQVRSTERDGTTFEVALPAGPAPDAGPGPHGD